MRDPPFNREEICDVVGKDLKKGLAMIEGRRDALRGTVVVGMGDGSDKDHV